MSHDTNRNEDGDNLFLDQVLTRLYDFGDGLASKNKLKSQKKKKRKICEEEEKGDITASKDVRHPADSRTEHVGVGHHQGRTKPDSTADPTGPAIRQLTKVEVVIFQDPTKKMKTKLTPAPDVKSPPQVKEKEKNNKDHSEEFTLEKARLEVHRFGITGYKKERQRSFEQERAIMLGAKPPKKEYVNYKVLQQQIKEKKQKAKEEVQPDLKKKKKHNKPRDKKKTSSGSASATLGQVGRFKNGVLVLSSKEVEKIKGK
ncbi:40S small subunit processome assembly factor 1 [Polymixia lowei]